MPSFVIIAIACAMAVGQTPQATPLDQSLIRVLLTFGSILVSCLMARVMVIACLDTTETLPAASTGTWKSSAQQRAQWEKWHLFVWLGMTAFLLFGIGWGTVVRVNWGLGSTILLDELVILIPLLCPWLISWTFFYDLEASSRKVSQEPGANRSTLPRWRFALQHARLVFGLGLLPVLGVSLISDIARHFNPELVGQPIPFGFFVIPMGLLIVAYPLILRRLWDTSTLPEGKLRSALRRFSMRSGIQVRETYIWHTGGKTLNAAVTGILPQMRYLFFTDRLLQTLPEQEVVAAMAHEFGHLRHRHLILRMAALFFPVTAIVALNGIAGQLAWSEMSSEVSATTVSPGILAFLTVTISILYLWKIVGGYSRRMELEADLAGWRLLSEYIGDKEATETYLAMLQRIHTGPENQGGWLHPPLAVRRDLVRRASLASNGFRDWHRGLRLVEVILYLTTATALFFSVV